jgi:hypothetical protein
MADDTKKGSLASEQLSHRTPRQTAMEKNDPANFDEGPAYDIRHGHPITKEQPTQDYKPLELKQPGEAKPLDIPAPFTIKGA